MILTNFNYEALYIQSSVVNNKAIINDKIIMIYYY